MSKLLHWIAGGTLQSNLYAEVKDQIGGTVDDDPEASIVDELQLDPLIDYYSDRLFGWLTVLIHEPRYYFFAPAAVEAITQYMRSKGFARQSSIRRREEIKRQLRYLEACLCEALCREEAPDARIIGINLWKRHWGQYQATVDRRSVLRTKGIQKQLGMHVTPRYLARAHALFKGETKRRAVLDLLDEAICSPLEPAFWWQDQLKLRTAISQHSKVFHSWLMRESKTRTMSIHLSHTEKELLLAALFGSSKRSLSQQFLSEAQKKLKLRSVKASPPSQILRELLPDLSKDLRQMVGEAATLAEAIGLIRYCYNSKLSEAYDTPDVRRAIARLARLRLPKALPRDSGTLANGGLAFVTECARAASSKAPLESLLEHIYNREKEIKGDRRKLYRSSTGIRVKPLEAKANAEDVRYQEPPIRLRNAHHVLLRIFTLRAA